MNQAAFLKHEQILPFLLVSGTAFLIAAQIALVVLCKYLLANEENNKLILRDLKIFFYIQFVFLFIQFILYFPLKHFKFLPNSIIFSYFSIMLSNILLIFQIFQTILLL